MATYQSSHTGAEIDAAVDAVSGKADKATTLAGYGITDAHTKTEDYGKFYALSGGTSLNYSVSNPVNLNTIVTPGSYFGSTTTGIEYCTNRPTNHAASFRIWVSEPTGTVGSSNIRQRFQYYDQEEIYERYTTNRGSSWNNWEKVQGAMVTVYSGNTAPSSSTGVDGDIYIQTS